MPFKSIQADIEDQLMFIARSWAERILNCSPVSIRAAKQVVNRGLTRSSLRDTMAGQEMGDYPALSEWSAGNDTKEGIDAFVEKRFSQWRNR